MKRILLLVCLCVYAWSDAYSMDLYNINNLFIPAGGTHGGELTITFTNGPVPVNGRMCFCGSPVDVIVDTYSGKSDGLCSGVVIGDTIQFKASYVKRDETTSDGTVFRSAIGLPWLSALVTARPGTNCAELTFRGGERVDITLINQNTEISLDPSAFDYSIANRTTTGACSSVCTA